MLFLGLAEDDFHHNGLLLIVDMKLVGLFLIKTIFVHQLRVSNQQLTELSTFFVEVIWTDLIEPQPDSLEILLFRLCFLHEALRLLLQLLNHLVLLGAPLLVLRLALIASESTLSFSVVAVALIATVLAALVLLGGPSPAISLEVIGRRLGVLE